MEGRGGLNLDADIEEQLKNGGLSTKNGAHNLTNNLYTRKQSY